MNRTIPALITVSILGTGLAAQRAAPDAHEPAVVRRVPVDVAVEGLGHASRPAGGAVAPIDCLESIADQATGGCLTATSSPTLGMLYPYPGLDNVFVPRAFVGGGEGNQATGPWSTVSGGQDNTASGYAFGAFEGHATAGGGRGNTAHQAYTTVAGGHYNEARWVGSTVGGGRRNTAIGYDGFGVRGHATVGGGYRNTARAWNATVGGGSGNEANGNASTVGGGSGNEARNDYCAVGGGRGNLAQRRFTTVGGGTGNFGNGVAATIGGGVWNTADGDSAVIGGGISNTAAGSRAAVPGGESNAAAGNHSFAAGRRAMANHDGAFVWGDGEDVDKVSSAANEFNVYADGGVRVFSSSDGSTGVLLAPGGGSWSSVSDRDAKENVEPVNARAVLEKVTELPVATWNYKSQDDSIRHMGPMAQDFHAAFGLGLGEKTIDTIDPNGVALAAIQGLNAELEERLAAKDAEIAENKAEIEGLRAANEALRRSDENLRARVMRLEKRMRR